MALLARLCWKKSVRPRRALNPWPPDYMSGALPSELPGPTSLFQPSPVQVTVVLITQCPILNIKSKKILYTHCKYSCIYICHFKENANHLMAVFQHSKLEVGSRILFFSFAIVRCQNCNIESSTFLDVMYSHWEQCREVIEESVVCELLKTKFFF